MRLDLVRLPFLHGRLGDAGLEIGDQEVLHRVLLVGPSLALSPINGAGSAFSTSYQSQG